MISGKRVFTVGVYDLLHIGHVHLFRRASKLGDYLIVAGIGCRGQIQA